MESIVYKKIEVRMRWFGDFITVKWMIEHFMEISLRKIIIIKKNKKYQEISLRKYLTNEEVKRRTGVESVVKKVEASKNGLDIWLEMNDSVHTNEEVKRTAAVESIVTTE